ncbi:MAG TPA: hypothetical protein VJ140_07790 [Actinomycetota bacterium]|nr:hypothetical protein [Actinomycetota bacterium]
MSGWSNQQKQEVAKILQGAIKEAVYGYELNCHAARASDCHRVWDRRRHLLRTRATGLVLSALRQIIGVLRRHIDENLKAAAHERSHFQNEEQAARFESFNSEHEGEARKYERLAALVRASGVPRDVLAKVDRWIPRATSKERKAAAADDARMRAQTRYYDKLAKKLHAAEGKGSNFSEDFKEGFAAVGGIIKRNVVVVDALLPDAGESKL